MLRCPKYPLLTQLLATARQTSCYCSLNVMRFSSSDNPTDKTNEDQLDKETNCATQRNMETNVCEETNRKGLPPESPLYCCMSGCNNCVWLQYVDEMMDYYGHDVRDKAIKQVMEDVTDPNMRAFLVMELQTKNP